MLKHIAISGLGPHADFEADLEPRGRTLVSGPSESGKSKLVEAVTFCLWGVSPDGRFASEAIRDGRKKVQVDLTLDSGRTLRRTMTRTRSTTRAILVGGEKETYKTERAFAEALGALGGDAEAVRVVIVPQAWVALAAGNARPLRDLLSRVLPEADVPAEVRALVREAGFEASEGEARLDEKEVMARRAAARKTRTLAEGREQKAAERIAELDAALAADPEGSPEASAADAEVIERAEAWATYDRSARDGGARERAEEAGRSWDRRLDELGPEPPAEPGAQEAARTAHAKQAASVAAQQALQEVYGRYQVAGMHVRQLGVHDPSVCPMCQRPGWAHGAQAVEQLRAQLALVQTELEQRQAAVQVAGSELASAQAALQQAQAATARRSTWEAAKRALGARPVAPAADAAAAQAPPVFDRPGADEVAAARARRDERRVAAGVRREREQSREAASAEVEREAADRAAASQEAERLDALLEAVRTAPSAVAARQAKALGDLGPLSLEFGDNPAVRVLVDGRPWWLASRGRLVVADIWLRAALRRALEMPYLPLFIDNRQDVGGQPLPEVPGPVIVLETTDGTELKIKRRPA